MEITTENITNGSPHYTKTTIPRAVRPQDVPENVGVGHRSLYFNRELSWLDFNWRVLAQAQDERIPLLERVRFLAISYANLDEFFRKRVGGLKGQQESRIRIATPDGRDAGEQLHLIQEAILPMYKFMNQTWKKLCPLLKAAGVEICSFKTLKVSEKKQLEAYFKERLFPILTPLGFDPGRPFPFLSNGSLSFAVMLKHPTRETEHFARVKVPNPMQWIPIDKNRFIPVEEVIREHIAELFRGMQVLSVHAFRITRNAEMDFNEDEAEDLLQLISQEVRKRRFAAVVRLEVEKTMPDVVRQLLMHELEIEASDVYDFDALPDLNRGFSLADLNLPSLKFDVWRPVIPIEFSQIDDLDVPEDIFSILRKKDVLVHHPYESFSDTVQAFVEKAAEDPKVVAIKQTLYRTSSDSPLLNSLLKAAERGKEVTVLVELKARFDEERNIRWANRLAQNGIHVTYGLVGLKTHAKSILVVREDEDGVIRTYCHVGTGNYNASTAKIYTDLGLFTSDPEIGSDLVNLFHYLTGYAPEQSYKALVIAPKSMRNRFIENIQAEIASHKVHGNGHIVAKMNALDDVQLIQELYKASQQGVKIDLIIRGHCRLRPGIPGYSDNIRVISIIGQFLEHHRIFYFYNNGAQQYFMGSADWMRRNLDDRVELITPIKDDKLKKRMSRLLLLAIKDNQLAWDLQADGHYVQRHPVEGKRVRNFHEELKERATLRAMDADMPWDL